MKEHDRRPKFFDGCIIALPIGILMWIAAILAVSAVGDMFSR